MSNFLSQMEGFTPVIDILAEELGLIPAAVYGLVWRHCQMKDRVCYASIETLAKKLGVGTATVHRHIKALCGAGYLEDLTPDLRNKPHTYRDTGRVQIVGMVQARRAAPPSVSPREEVDNNAAPDVPEGGATFQSGTSHSIAERHVPESSMRIVLRDQEERIEDTDLSAAEAADKLPPHKAYYVVLRDICSLDMNVKSNQGRINRCAKELRNAGFDPDLIKKRFGKGGWWYTSFWKGKRGQSPLPEDVGKHWGDAAGAEKGDAPYWMEEVGGRTVHERRAEWNERVGKGESPEAVARELQLSY